MQVSTATARFVMSLSAVILLLRAGPCATFDGDRCTKTLSVTPTEFDMSTVAGTSVSSNFAITLSDHRTCTFPLTMAGCDGPDARYWDFTVPNGMVGGIYSGTVTFHPPADEYSDVTSHFCFGLIDGNSRPITCTTGPCKCTLGPASFCNPSGLAVTHSYYIKLTGHVYGPTFATVSPLVQTIPMMAPDPMTIQLPLKARMYVNVAASQGKAEPMAIKVTADPAEYAEIGAVPAVVNPGTTSFDVTLKPRYVRPGLVHMPKITLTVSAARTKTGGAPQTAVATVEVVREPSLPRVPAVER